MQFRIQYVVRNLTKGKHLAQHFRDFDRSSTYQYRTACLHHLLDFFDNSLILFTLGLIHPVIHINTGNRTVGRDYYHIQFVDVPEFTRFGFCCTGHTCQLVIHTEIILECNRCKSLGSSFHLHSFFGFYSLMQAIAPATSFHNTAGLFVNNLHLTVHDYVIGIFFEHRVCLQQLVDGMYTFCLDGIVRHEFIFFGKLFFIAQSGSIFQFRKLGCNIGQHKQCRILRFSGNQVDTLIGQVYALQFFVNYEIQRFYRLGHTLVVLLHIDFFGLQHACLDTRFAQELNKWLVLRQRLMTTEQGKETGFLVFFLVRSYQTLGICQILSSQFTLCFYQSFHQRAKHFEQLLVTFGHRTGNNQRRTCIVNQDRVDLIDNGIIMLTLYQVFGAYCHIVTQIIEAEFVIGTKCNVCHISTAAGFRVGLMLVNAIHAQTMEHIKRPHPFRVTLSQVIIYGYDMHTVSGQRIEEYRKRSHQSLTFTCCHFGNLALMQYHTTEKLYIIMHHIPGNLITTSYPMILPDSLFTFYPYEITSLCSQIAIHFGSCDLDFFILGETTCRIFYNRKSCRQHIIQCLFVFVEHLFLQLVYLIENRLTFFDVCCFDSCFQVCNLLSLCNCRILDILFQFFCLGTQLIVRQLLDFRIYFLYLVYPRLNLFHVTSSLVSENLTYKFIKSHFMLLFLLFLLKMILLIRLQR